MTHDLITALYPADGGHGMKPFRKHSFVILGDDRLHLPLSSETARLKSAASVLG